jgi:indole-3-glycerol phosphate synthase / phosphoribosylanthranilate isomerase
MNRIQELLKLKRAEIEANKSTLSSIPIPSDQRFIYWDRSKFRIIAELKRASLSAGNIRPDLQPVGLARSYEAAGASAISVLTEQNFFHGSLQDLIDVRAAVSLPILQKDFILDPSQIAQAKIAGANFVLLIARFLSKTELSELLRFTEQIGMNAIVEITSREDLLKLERPVRYLGVNSRDLETLEVDTNKFEALRPFLPDAFLIAESGIRNLETLQKVIGLGYNGALIGEQLLRSVDPAAELSRFVTASAGQHPKVKICGITSERDAMMAIHSGAAGLGFIFAESPRRVSKQALKSFRDRIPESVLCVGVFRGQTDQEIMDAAKEFRLDVAQIYDNVRPRVRTWQAKVVKTLSDFGLDNHYAPVLWDLKAEEMVLRILWKEAAKKNVFALAGGLNPDNVAAAVELCKPDWVDVARGVEHSPGIKDESKVRAFMRHFL